MRLGILGGTFDPPHVGHLVIAQDACSRLPLDRVLFIPASRPPHKEGVPRTSASIRLELVEAAIAGVPGFEASDMELRREGPSWTVDTLRQLSAERPDAELFLLLGSDQLGEFATWRGPEEIADLATLVAVPRGGVRPTEAVRLAGGALAGARVVPLDTVRIDVSSTDIRRRVAAGESIRHLVPESVRQLIVARGLYADAER